jgi:RNA polymerase sigma-70 factor, ECF subfamily
MLYKICNLYAFTMHDRQDLFQEIIIQLWKSFPSFRHEAKFSTWLYRIALNTALAGLRKKKNVVSNVEPENLPVLQDFQYNNETEERIRQLHDAIKLLSELEKAIVMLYLEDRSYDEMEDILGINQNNLRVKMNRIKEKLRKLTKAVDHGTG